jgi:hypothetical protein
LFSEVTRVAAHVGFENWISPVSYAGADDVFREGFLDGWETGIFIEYVIIEKGNLR